MNICIHFKIDKYKHCAHVYIKLMNAYLSNTGSVSSEKLFQILNIFPIQMCGAHTNV